MRKTNWWTIELVLGVVLAGCGAADPGATATGQGGAAGEGGAGGTAITDGPAYFPLTIGATWSYRISDPTGATADKATTVEALEPGDGLNGPLAFRIRNEALDGVNVNWEQLSGTAIVRYRQDRVDAAGNVLVEKTYAPSSVVFDESAGRLVAGGTWNEAYTETQAGAKNAPKTSQESVTWTVEATDDVVSVPAGTFTCIRVRRHQPTSKNPADEVAWYASGTGKVKETGGGTNADQTRELVSASLP